MMKGLQLASFQRVTCRCRPNLLRKTSLFGLHTAHARPQWQDETGLDQLELSVPKEQRPVNQLSELKAGVLYGWGGLDQTEYIKRLVILWGAIFTLFGAPISYQTFDPTQTPAEFFLAGGVGAMLFVCVLVIRIYLGWSYVGNRLLSATVDYEETGWYDGQTFVKPPEILARDRLLGLYDVKPTLQRLKSTLVGAGVTLAASAVLLSGLIAADTDEYGQYGRSANRQGRGVGRITATGVAYSQNTTDLSKLAEDDELAAEEAIAQGGRPGYCGDRYSRAMSGGMGSICNKFDP